MDRKRALVFPTVEVADPLSTVRAVASCRHLPRLELGWQAGVIVFFLAPFAGCVIALLQWVLTRSKLIAFGPFLCSAALVVIVCWAAIWDRFFILFINEWFVPTVCLAGLVMLAGMLFVWQRIKQALFAYLLARRAS